MVSDAYIERLIETSEGELIDLLKQRYVPKEHVVIDCKSIRTEEEFIRQLKRGSGLSAATGLNWMAMDDLFYDAMILRRDCPGVQNERKSFCVGWMDAVGRWLGSADLRREGAVC